MWVDFETLPSTSRVWVYQANRPIEDGELEQMNARLKNFATNWKRHGESLRASFKIVYNQFVVFAVDENFNDVSGCSIDASVHFVQELENEFDIDLMDKMKVTFKDGSTINICSIAAFKQYVKEQKIKPSTIVFNNLINSKADLESNWEVEASKSWHSKFFNLANPIITK